MIWRSPKCNCPQLPYQIPGQSFGYWLFKHFRYILLLFIAMSGAVAVFLIPEHLAWSQVWGSRHEGGCEASRRTAPGAVSNSWKMGVQNRRNHSGFNYFMISCWTWQNMWSQTTTRQLILEPGNSEVAFFCGWNVFFFLMYKLTNEQYVDVGRNFSW